MPTLSVHQNVIYADNVEVGTLKAPWLTLQDEVASLIDGTNEVYQERDDLHKEVQDLESGAREYAADEIAVLEQRLAEKDALIEDLKSEIMELTGS